MIGTLWNLFLAGCVARIVNDTWEFMWRDTPEQWTALNQALGQSRIYNQLISQHGATKASVLRALGFGDASAEDVGEILGVPWTWPLDKEVEHERDRTLYANTPKQWAVLRQAILESPRAYPHLVAGYTPEQVAYILDLPNHGPRWWGGVLQVPWWVWPVEE